MDRSRRRASRSIALSLALLSLIVLMIPLRQILDRRELFTFSDKATVSDPAIMELSEAGGYGASIAATARPNLGARAPVCYAQGQLSLGFEVNEGQLASNVKFVSRASGHTLYLTSTDAVLELRSSPRIAREKKFLALSVGPHYQPPSPNESKSVVLRTRLVGGCAAPEVKGLDELTVKSNYFLGNDPRKWLRGVTNYARVRYREVYPGVDLIYRTNQNHLEYDFKVAPGANPGVIRLAFEGAQKIQIDGNGDLILNADGNEVRQRRPLAYQEVDGIRREVSGRYIMRGASQVGFEMGRYDPSQQLVIDPEIVYSTYFGGNGDDEGRSISVDLAGNVYVTGSTQSTNFPMGSPSQPLYGGRSDAFVAKIDATGSTLLYVTYLGGRDFDGSNSIAVDASGNAYVTGYTSSNNFPASPGAFQSVLRGTQDAFVTTLNATGSISYSTYLGGDDADAGNGIAGDSFGSVYLTGVTYSRNFPTVNPFQATYGGAGNLDVFVAKIDATGSRLVYSTYLGRGGNDAGAGIAVGSSGSAYVTGYTGSRDFPTTLGAFQTSFGGGVYDAFISKLSANGESLVYSTFLGGRFDDLGRAIALDLVGNCYVTGQADSGDFPIENALHPVKGGGSGSINIVDAFVTKLNLDGSRLSYSTYLGGSRGDIGFSIAVDSFGNAYVTGETISPDFPTSNAVQKTILGSTTDAFVAKLDATGSTLSYSTYLGGTNAETGYGIALDSHGNAYVVGNTFSGDFPTLNALQPARGSFFDAFVVKLGAPSPRITGALISGKHLLVFGENFDDDPVVLLDGEQRKTRKDDQNTLFSKKTGKIIAPGQTVTLQVRNADGALSSEFRFTRSSD